MRPQPLRLAALNRPRRPVLSRSPAPFPCLAAALCLIAAGCAPLPGEATLPPAASLGTPPALLPLDQLLAQAAVTPRATPATAAALEARAAALRARTGTAR